MYRKTFTTPEGKRKYVTAHTEKELDEKITALKMQMHAGVNITDGTTFGEYAQTWLNVYKKPTLKDNSYKVLLDTLNTHVMPYLATKRLKDIKPANIMQVMSELTGYSQSIQSKVYRAMKCIFDTAVDNGLIIKSPVVSSIKPHGAPAEEKIPLTRQQSEDLLNAIADTESYLMVLLMLDAGLRREEALGLMWQDIDFESQTLSVRRACVFVAGKSYISEELKSRAAYRRVPMTQRLASALRSQKHTSLYVVPMTNGAFLTPAAFRAKMELIDRRNLGFHVHAHLLRHTCITRWFEAGLDIKEIQRLAGHSTPDMTMRVYTHYSAAERESETAAKIRALG